MAGKIGDEYVRDMLDRGRRELGGALFTESNVAQPMYPLRGGYEPPKEAEGNTPEAQNWERDGGSILQDRLKQAEESRGDPGRDDKTLDRE